MAFDSEKAGNDLTTASEFLLPGEGNPCVCNQVTSDARYALVVSIISLSCGDAGDLLISGGDYCVRTHNLDNPQRESEELRLQFRTVAPTSPILYIVKYGPLSSSTILYISKYDP